MTPKAVIFGCAGPALSAWEADFFAASDPLGFILFARNCEAPEQIRALTAALRATVGRNAPILIDQEGGRVQRLKPPHWRAAPAPRRFGEVAERDPSRARDAAHLNARLLAAELLAIGVTVDCLPLLDLRFAEAHEVIGDRAFAGEPGPVAELGRACCEGLLAGGVLPVIKHIPGHGRALVDSHHTLPRVATERAELERSDFASFRDLADMPLAMTGHVVYESIDPDEPATTSAKVIDEVIRGWMGFDGLLMSDDLSMAALAGDLGERAARSLAAGCDVALHCNGDAEEMDAVARAVGPLSTAAVRRWQSAEARLVAPTAIDPAEASARLDALLGLG